MSTVSEITPVPVPPPSGNTGIQGEIKLSVQYKHDALQVMVMHVKDLVSHHRRLLAVQNPSLFVSQLGLVARRSAGKREDAGSTPRFGSPFSSKIVIYGHCLVTALLCVFCVCLVVAPVLVQG